MIILRRHSSDPQLHMPDDRPNNSAKLDIRKLLPDAAVSAGTKGLVGRVGALGHEPEPIVDLGGLVLVLEGGTDRGVGRRGIGPARWQPLVVVSPYARVHLRDERRGKDEMPRWDDVLAVLGGCCEGWRDGEVLFNFALQTVRESQSKSPAVQNAPEYCGWEGAYAASRE